MTTIPCPSRHDLEAFARSQVRQVQIGEIGAQADAPECRQVVAKLRDLVTDELAETRVPVLCRTLSGDANSLLGFRILRQLGTGGLGRVYRAEKQRLGRFVAIKCLVPPSSDRLGLLLQREIGSLAQMNHPHLVRANQAGDKNPSSIVRSAKSKRVATGLPLVAKAESAGSQSGVRHITHLLVASAILLAVLVTAVQIMPHIRHADGAKTSFKRPPGSEGTTPPSGEVDVALSADTEEPQSVTEADDVSVFERIIDNGDSGYCERGDGWGNGSEPGGYGGDYRFNDKGAISARWEFRDLSPGKYEVFITWVKRSGDDSKVHTEIFDGETRLQWTFVAMNRETRDALAHGHRWQRLGTYEINSGVLTVEIDCRVTHGGCAADAVRIVRVEKGVTKSESSGGHSDGKSGRSRGPLQRPVLNENEWIIDDGDDGYSERGNGWATGSLPGGYANDYRYNHESSISARWQFRNLLPGKYAVFITWVRRSDANSKVHTTIRDGKILLKSTKLVMNRDPDDELAHGHPWQRLGTFETSSEMLAVEIDCRVSQGNCAADAVRIVRLGNHAPTGSKGNE